MVIRMRHTRAHTRNRRSHHALVAPAISKCSHCGGETRPHHMCLSCGYYNGRQVLDLTAAKTRRDARIKASQERMRVDTGAQPQATHEHAPEEVKVEEAEKPKKVTRGTRTGSSSKKEKQEGS